MSHKEKAKELIDTYRYALSIPNSPLGDYKDNIAKQCALIAVNNEIESMHWLNLLCPFDNYMKQFLNSKIEELKEVKQEIENYEH